MDDVLFRWEEWEGGTGIVCRLHAHPDAKTKQKRTKKKLASDGGVDNCLCLGHSSNLALARTGVTVQSPDSPSLQIQKARRGWDKPEWNGLRGFG